uniref:Uncharacterized protein n=1 Tax=Arundo donax TaxID=35708 RepID=A0A0A8YUD1_ARUDO
MNFFTSFVIPLPIHQITLSPQPLVLKLSRHA